MKITHLLPAVAVSLSLLGGPALADTTACTPVNVGVFTNRIHVKCSASTVGGIWYFALPTTDAEHCNRMLTVLTTALEGARSLTIDYNPSSTAGTSIGCLSTDCRLINWAMVW